ncbi:MULTISPECIES: hypothetical protein [unclassified Nodularia (in: cyanobacteria)]|uniref:hypothetical protein n=1 Tax=unclassified Nodularia (in: cyanobacteria) TaxID=2656917 RepID=UPI001882A8B6|nr:MULTISPECIES: hypothetical protein [unclassified Nodularia (in: cyanobacteria)]MBE9199077.1 hypothetical protein [Nodularia sp. LEGE 06071]MCC2694079.1 hypothetical protein [Nodularia sp. LEGE 04288]
MDANFIKVGNEIIINTNHVTHLRRTFEGDVFVAIVGDEDNYLRLSGEKAVFVWNYFSELDATKDE